MLHHGATDCPCSHWHSRGEATSHQAFVSRSPDCFGGRSTISSTTRGRTWILTVHRCAWVKHLGTKVAHEKRERPTQLLSLIPSPPSVAMDHPDAPCSMLSHTPECAVFSSTMGTLPSHVCRMDDHENRLLTTKMYRSWTGILSTTTWRPPATSVPSLMLSLSSRVLYSAPQAPYSSAAGCRSSCADLPSFAALH